MTLQEIFQKCQELSLRKRSDYTSSTTNHHENFIRSAEIASWFTSDKDKPYAVLIGTKLARLGSLLNSKKEPNNESINDSFEDLINYCALWYEMRSAPEHPNNKKYYDLLSGTSEIKSEAQLISEYNLSNFKKIEGKQANAKSSRSRK